MTPFFSFKANVFVFILCSAILSTVTYAFASSDTGNPEPAGQGSNGISGYVVANVSYQLGDDPTKISSVSFTLNAAAAKVQIQLSDTQTDWYNCVNSGGNDWVCNANNSPLASANELQVIALDN